MEAAEARIQRILEGSKQFLVPHYQRPYSWQDLQWKTLWRDIIELLQEEEPKPHFLGSIVTCPARSVPEGVEKRLLIDGQQRLTTLLILLTVIRDRARATAQEKLAERIQDLVTNRHEEGNDNYKLLPTQGENPNESDREAFISLIDGNTRDSESWISGAYAFFASKLRQSDAPELDRLFRVIINKITLVSIILDDKDNPHRIFESLNGKGRPLSQADLIRNYFFMRIHEKEHERVYVDLWRPMQRRLGEESLTDFVRHYITKFGNIIRETEVYSALKKRIDEDQNRSPKEHLQEITRYSEYYEVLLRPEVAKQSAIRERLERLNRLEVTVAYPLLLAVYADFVAGDLTEADLCTILDTLESYLVRRFVCGIPTTGLNKVFAPLYEQARAGGNLVAGVKRILAAKSYPRDDHFRRQLGSASLYGAGARREKTKLILERLEEAFGHKERVLSAALTIEHIMPQTLTDSWKEHLGPNWEDDHDQLLHTLGNLTLTNYNPELSNSSFHDKKALFAHSHIELNRYFANVEHWTANEIERRAEVLSDLAISIWPYFGPLEAEAEDGFEGIGSVTGTVPSRVHIRGEEITVQSWADVVVATMDGIIKTGHEEFARILAEFPKLVGWDSTAFRRSSRPRRLSNGAYVETNMSAVAIHRLCVQATQIAELGSEAWSVVYAPLSQTQADEDDAVESTPTHIKQLQLEFWTSVREALLRTGMTSLRTPRPQHWFDIALGRSHIWMSLTTSMVEKRVGVKIMLGAEIAERAIDIFTRNREAIESEIGSPLEWNPHPEKRTKTILLYHQVNIIDRATWPESIEWLVKTALAFRSAFASRIADLDIKT